MDKRGKCAAGPGAAPPALTRAVTRDIRGQWLGSRRLGTGARAARRVPVLSRLKIASLGERVE